MSNRFMKINCNYIRIFNIPFLVIFSLIIFCISIQSGAQVKNIGVYTELQKLYDISKLPQYVEQSAVKQISSYDRTGGNDDGFSGKYSYLRENEKGGGLIIFDAKGAGVIERIWTPTPTDDTLDFYFDASKKPSFSIRFRDLFTGNVVPFLKPLVQYHLVGGYYSYVPIPYKNGCKIVFRGKKLMFHQIQYREYDKGYAVQTFNTKLTKAENEAFNKVAVLWSNVDKSADNFYSNKMSVINNEISLQPGETKTLAHLTNAGRITGIEIIDPAIFEGNAKQLDLKITWDNEAKPAVYVPVADFFGFAFGERSMRALLMGSTDSKLYCYMPMPFDKSARVELVYRKDETTAQKNVVIRSKIYYTNEKRNPATEGKFYVYWNTDNPPPGEPQQFLKGSGKGHYVATLLQSQATEFKNFTEFFEGDDKTIIDGEMAMHGTGSEDYFNGGWYAQPGGWVEKLGGPVSGCLDYSLPKSRTGGYRFFITDKMTFNKSIDHTMEHGPVNNNREVTYTSVAMYYAAKPVAVNMPPANESTKIFIPAAYSFYTRLMKHLSYNGGLEFKNDQAELTGSDNAALNISVNEIPKGRYKLYLHKTDAGNSPVEVKVAHERGNSNWVQLPAAKQGDDVYIGDVEVSDFYVPVSVLFRSKVTNPGLKFDRVMLVK